MTRRNGFVALAALGAAALLAACVPGASGPTASGAGVPTTVAEAEVALTAADQVALQYVVLPKCPVATGVLCSDPAISAQIKAKAGAAYAAVKAAAASGNSVDLAAANAAIAALTALVPATK